MREFGMKIHEPKDALKLAQRRWYLANKERVLKQQAAWRAANPEKRKEARRRYYASNKEKIHGQNREWALRNPKKRREIEKRCEFRRRLLRYGIDDVTYKRLFAEQKGLCAVCGRRAGKKGLAIDHNHVTGKVRGLLCGKCNLGIGYFVESEEALLAAVAYLRRHGET